MNELAERLLALPWKKYKDYLNTEKVKVLKDLELYLSDLYHNTGESDFPDDRFDLLRDTLKERDVKYAPKIGAKLREGENRVKLPFWLGSMDKITPDTPDQLERWFNENKAPSYVVSAKLDGVSCLLVSENKTISLYTRGDGEVGANISYLLAYFKSIPKDLPDIAVRGELIIPRKVFEEKYKDQTVNGRTYKNPRNMVSGLIGGKTARQGLEDINFVTYEIVLDSAPKPSVQLSRLKKLGFLVVQHEIVRSFTMKTLPDTFLQFRKTSDYELDGIIVQSDASYDRNPSGNPDYAFAFKMRLEDSVYEAEVLSIEWNVSKWGQIKPVVIIDPVELEGVTISRATAHNAKYVVENNLGPGSIIKITRSKDVIPYIVEVVSGTQPSLPNVPYVWDKNHVNIIASKGDSIMCVKLISEFFAKLGIKHVSEATVGKMYKNGLDTLLKIVGASKERLLKVPEFQEKSAERIYTNIRNGLQNIKIPVLLGSCGVLGYGIGRKKVDALFLAIPNLLLIHKTKSVREMKNLIMGVEGFSDLTAEKIVTNLKYAELFVEKMSKYATFQQANRVSDILKGHKYVMSGFRDKKLEEEIAMRGGKVTTSVSKNTTGLILQSKGGAMTGKPLKAKELGIPIYTKEEFIAKYLK